MQGNILTQIFSQSNSLFTPAVKLGHVTINCKVKTIKTRLPIRLEANVWKILIFMILQSWIILILRKKEEN